MKGRLMAVDGGKEKRASAAKNKTKRKSGLNTKRRDLLANSAIEELKRELRLIDKVIESLMSLSRLRKRG